MGPSLTDTITPGQNGEPESNSNEGMTLLSPKFQDWSFPIGYSIVSFSGYLFC